MDWDSSTDSVSRRVRLAVLLTVIALVLTAIRLYFHELWRDEAWLWLAAIESRTLSDLLAELSRTGQGYLFALLCWLAAQISHAPQVMQLLNLAIVGASTYVIARWAPLRPTERVLAALGYYVFYEYAVISRHYATGVLLIWLVCVAARAESSFIGLGLALGLLCQTTVYGYIIALAIGAGFVFDRYWRRHELVPISWRDASIGAVLAVAGAIAGLVQLIPESGTSFAVGWRFGWETAPALATLQTSWHAFVPVTQFGVQFWNSDVLAPWPDWQAAAGAAMLLLAMVMLWPRKLALGVFVVGTLAMLAFGYVKYLGVPRHHGHLWLLFIAAVWLGGGLGRESDRRTWREYLLLAVLVVQCGAMAFASWVDLGHPFSNGASTAELIRSKGLNGFPLLGYREPPAASVSLALGRPMYAASRNVYATHTDWGPLQRDLTLSELRCAARALAHREGRDIVLVMNSELPPWPEIQFAGSEVGAIVPTENYFLYRLGYGVLPQTLALAGCSGEPPGS